MTYIAVGIILIVVFVYIARSRKRHVTTADAQPISYSQVDITERFDDNFSLKPDEWINTIPLNRDAKNPESMGLPPRDADADRTYAIAAGLSRLREQIPIPSDGVYCPVCHIANTDIRKLHSPCPRCGRELLKFGWD